jgi:hypothetical protein
MAVKDNTPAEKPVKKSILQTVIENNYLKMLVTGEIWNLPENEIKAIEETLVKFRIVLSKAFKMHDEELSTRRNIHGSDYGLTLEYFRKPRESKEEKSLADEFDMAADE